MRPGTLEGYRRYIEYLSLIHIFLLSFCGGIGIIEGGKIAVYCDDNVARVNERGSLGTVSYTHLDVYKRQG